MTKDAATQPPSNPATVIEYHDATRHYFNRFARSLGYLDWATQPDPFRRYADAPLVELPRAPLQQAGIHPIDLHSIGEFLRCSMGLSAWKQFGSSRWALRVNPSSGNLHPTETYVIWQGRVSHYAVREHALEERCLLDAEAWDQWGGPLRPADPFFLVALTSIHWREAWKYGERAFRYCQHDAGHAIGALRFAASLLGWRMTLLPQWSTEQVGALLGTSRDPSASLGAGRDFVAAEPEEPECIAVVSAGDLQPWLDREPTPLVEAAQRATWRGSANQLSRDRLEWPIIDEVMEATRFPGTAPSHRRTVAPSHPYNRELLLQRRSALAFDARSALTREAFVGMLQRLQPTGPPWDAIDWEPHVHLALFIHRVDGLVPGVYAYLRDAAVCDEWKAAMRPDFLWEQVEECLFLLLPIDCRRAANRVSCDQEIAEDGFFSLGMLARFEGPLRERGAWMYRRLFWECGLIGQVLYLEAEAVGARATGIGCYYDEPVHEILGLTGHAWQSLYHFSMGMPVEDTRLTTEPGYPWEATKTTKTG